jgi:hypothetical protein
MLRRHPGARLLPLVSLLVLSSTPVLPQEDGLVPMGSEEELAAFLKELQDAQPPEPTYESSDGETMESVITTGTRAAPDSITNSQHAGVDEGGIVKQHGDHLVVLRRGRLFTVDISGTRLHPVSTVNANGPDLDPDGTWYDEMLISGDNIVVIGYSYDRDATEIGLFNINSNGVLRYRATYHFRSYDYYSSRNYASRLIGSKLILYAPLGLTSRSEDPLDVLPAIRKWHEGADDESFKRIITARQIYRGPAGTQGIYPILHSMTVCDLARIELRCKATGVVGAWGRVFYVSPKAMYVWADYEPVDPDSRESGILFRMPLNGDEPSAIGVSGGPVDQFSFDETRDGVLNVLVQSDSEGNAMWDSELSQGSVALLRLPVRSFGDGSRTAPASAYRPLPSPPEDGSFHNRFVGKYLLYGSGEGWFDEEVPDSKVFVVPTKGGAVSELALPHGVDRIEALGSNAVIVGEGGENLHFTGIRLSRSPAIAQRYELKNAGQGEVRSHGFFYKPDGRGGGVLGLPVNSPAAPGYEHLFEESAGVVFLRKSAATFEDLGQLRAHDEGAIDDACESSCVDWYGNSRPIFIEDRVFALLGYELVEGRVRSGGIRELRRVNFAPRVVTAATEP